MTHLLRLIPIREGTLAISNLPMAASEWFFVKVISALVPLAFSASIIFPDGEADLNKQTFA